MDDLEQKLFHRIFTLECDRDRLRDDLAASERIAARYAAALAKIRRQWEANASNFEEILGWWVAEMMADEAGAALAEGA